MLQLDSISLNERQSLGELCLHRHAVLHNFATGQGNYLMDRSADLQGILPWGRLLDFGMALNTGARVAGSAGRNRPMAIR